MKKRKIFYCFLIFSLFFSSFLFSQIDERKNPFSVSFDDSVQSLPRGESYQLKIKFHVPKGYFLYADKTKVTFTNQADLILVKKVFPKPEKRFDPFFKKEADVYFHDFEVIFLFRVPSNLSFGRRTLEGEIRYQGCSDDFCYNPKKINLLVPIEIISVPVILRGERPKNPAESTGSFASLRMTQSYESGLIEIGSILKKGKLEQLIYLNPLLVLFFAFLGGFLTAFTPCVLPIIPLTLAVIGIKKQRSLLKNFSLSFCLVIGISVTYAVLGLVSSLLGLSLGFLFQSRYFLGFLVFFYLLMTLSLLGILKFQLPLSARNFFSKIGGKGYIGSFLAGLALGFIASPCVGPLISPLLLLVAQGQNIIWGGILLFVYGFGMGIIFLLGGTFYSSLGSKIRGGNYTKIIQRFLAVTMILPAIYYSYILFSQVKGDIHREGWKSSLQEGFEVAKKDNKPILIDFYADWCLPCLELDHKTFSDPKVKEELKNFVLIKIDCTLENSTCTEAVNRYNVVGWPTLLFLDKNQNLQKDLSVMGGFVGPRRMIELLEETKKR